MVGGSILPVYGLRCSPSPPTSAGLFLPATPALEESCSLWLVLAFDIRFPANYRLRSAPSVNSACAAPRGITTAVLASAPLRASGVDSASLRQIRQS